MLARWGKARHATVASTQYPRHPVTGTTEQRALQMLTLLPAAQVCGVIASAESPVGEEGVRVQSHCLMVLPILL